MTLLSIIKNPDQDRQSQIDSKVDRSSITTYHISEGALGEWSIMNQNDEVLFTGSLVNCQYWLDRGENAHRSQGFWSFLQSFLLRDQQI